MAVLFVENALPASQTRIVQRVIEKCLESLGGGPEHEPEILASGDRLLPLGIVQGRSPVAGLQPDV
jgi:hypothetical protein